MKTTPEIGFQQYPNIRLASEIGVVNVLWQLTFINV